VADEDWDLLLTFSFGLDEASPPDTDLTAEAQVIYVQVY
jgi:hypothetical protein